MRRQSPFGAMKRVILEKPWKQMNSRFVALYFIILLVVADEEEEDERIPRTARVESKQLLEYGKA